MGKVAKYLSRLYIEQVSINNKRRLLKDEGIIKLYKGIDLPAMLGLKDPNYNLDDLK